MKNRALRRYGKPPRTTAECRANQGCPYSRGKRCRKNLDSWNLRSGSDYQKTWKVRRKTQYHAGGRGERHEYVVGVEGWSSIRWGFEDYCENHNIPYCIENITEPYTYTHTIYTKRVKWYKRRKYQRKWVDRQFVNDYTHPIGWEWVYRTVALSEPIIKKRQGTRVTAYRLVWWSNKDIGIEYIINKKGYD